MSSLAQLNHQKMRIAAVLALGKIGGIKAAAALKTTLMDNDPVVQVTALKAWASIKQRSE
jgi:HEAT repeat protein